MSPNVIALASFIVLKSADTYSNIVIVCAHKNKDQ